MKSSSFVTTGTTKHRYLHQGVFEYTVASFYKEAQWANCPFSKDSLQFYFTGLFRPTKAAMTKKKITTILQNVTGSGKTSGLSTEESTTDYFCHSSESI